MKKILEFIKKYWQKFVTLAQTKEFVFTFPMAVLAVVLVCTRSFLILAALVIWLITIFLNQSEK